MQCQRHVDDAARRRRTTTPNAMPSGRLLCTRCAVLRRQSRHTLCTRAGSLPRLFAHPLNAGSVELSAEESKHATKALRLRAGDECELFDGLGHVARSRISHVDTRGGATVDAEAPAFIPWTGARWTLAVAVTGIGNRADWCVEKCAELGVHTFVPLLTERCSSRQRRGGEGAAEHARWVRLSAAASKQSLRVHSMCIAASTRLEDLLQSGEVGKRPTLVALQGGGPLRIALGRDELQDGGLLVVGPPGDFTDAEKQAMAQVCAISVGLGELRLRTETAAIALVAACQLHS